MSSILPFLDGVYLAVELCFLLSGFVMAHVYGARLAEELANKLVEVRDRTLRSHIHFLGSQRWRRPSSLPAAALGFRPKLAPPNLHHQHGNRSVYHFPFAGFLVTGKPAEFVAGCGVASVAVLSVAGGESLKLFY